LAVVQNRPHFHVSIIQDVSPYCDCHAENDAPIVPNIGMLASFDPVALDQASADLVNRAKPLADTVLSESPDLYHDHFKNIFPETDWQSCLDHAEAIDLGSRQYDLVEI
jgi:uncharacterized Fe-S center protein